MHKNCIDPDKRFPADFQFPPPPPPPPPPSFEFPDLPCRRSPEPHEPRPPVRNPLDYAFEDRDHRIGLICVSDCPELAQRLTTTAHVSSRIRPLIINHAMFRRIEAIDLAVKLRTGKQTQRDAEFFDHRNNESASTNRSQLSANEAFYSRPATVEGGLIRTHTGQPPTSPPPPRLVTVDRCLGLQGRFCDPSNRFGDPCAARSGRDPHQSRAGGEYPRSITARDLRRWCKVVTRMPVIEETEKASSGDEEQDLKVSDYQPSNRNESDNMVSEASPPKFSSLLDLMHKRYCPDQYVSSKSQSEKSCLETDLSANPEKSTTTSKSLQLTQNTSDCFTGNATSRCCRVTVSLSADEPSSCKPDRKAGRNLTPLLLVSPVSLSSSPAASPSSAHSLESPAFLSPSSWDDDDAMHAGEGGITDTEQQQQQTSPEASWDDDLTTQLENTTKIEDSALTGAETEVEAVEACEWLREAGFPQYAQMYKDNQFPIDLKTAERDHEFLDDDAIQAFFRRLDVLNKCSSSKLKRSPAKKNSIESDDEEECALSNKWTFQRNSRLWSRNEANLLQAIPHLTVQPDLSVNGHLHSASSRESVFDDVLEKLSSVSAPSCALLLPSGGENGTAAAAAACSNVWRHDPVVLNRDFSRSDAAEISKATKLKRPNLFLAPLSSGVDKQDRIRSKKVDECLQLNKNRDDVFHNTNNLKLLVNNVHRSDPIQSRNLSDSETLSFGPGSTSGDQQKVSGEKVRGPLGIFRRMEGLTTRKSARKLSKSDLTKKDIGTPVLVESPEILMKIDSLQCTDISPASENAKISVQNSDGQKKAPSENRQFLPGTPLLHPLNIPRNSEKRLKCNGDTPRQTLQQNRGDYRDKSSPSDSHGRSDSVESPSASEVSSSKDLEDTLDIISELLHSVNLEMSTTKNNRKRISIYDNVSSEVCSVLQNELDALLGELYKNIDSLDYSMSKVTSKQRVESSTSSIGPVNEEDLSKALPTVPPKEHLIAKDSLGSCDSTDGNSSTTPSEGSYNLESAAAKHRSTIGRLIEAASAIDRVSEEAFQLTEDSKCIQMAPVEIQSDLDSEDSVEQTADDWSYPNRGGARERRDSGVGSSLTRTASSKRQKRARLRWHSFAKSHQITLNSYEQPISNLSAGLLSVLRRLSLLKVTAALEKYSPVSRNNWSWFVPRLRRRSKMPDYSERNVFGIPVSVTERRNGQPLPQCILYAMRHLRRSAGVTVGMFRKPGVKMRVQTLRIALETDPDAIDFDGLHAYDVADLLKLYFRELPECLLTNKLSNVFISIFLYIPVDLRHDLIRMTLLLLPDENRLVLQSLLLFLNDVAQHSQLNQMNASNLAVCFAPSLFHLCGAISSSSSSPKQLQRRVPTPSEKDLVEQKVAHECLAYMITNVKSIFTVSEEMLSMCKLSYMEHGNPISLEALCRKYGKCDTGNHTAYVDSCIQGVLKESREKFKGWISYSASRGDVDLAYKKVGDGHPLRLWKFCVEVEAPPEEVLNRVMRERHLWDEDILKWRAVEKLDSQTEIFQYVLNSMVPHPTRDFSELRSWRTNLSRGMCVLISTSVEHANAPLMGDVRGVVLASRYLIEPCGSGKSRLTHIIRIDLRGHSPDWYNSVYGYICANYARRIRDSFKNGIDLTAGPETKV